MKTFLRILCAVVCSFSFTYTTAQCPSGYTATAVNWDALAFLIQDASFVSNAIATNQKFAFGKNQMTITHNYSAANTLGDNTTNTATIANYGDGADVQFIGDGRITVSFQTAVHNVRFALHDIDYGQRVVITASNGSALNVIIEKVTGTQLAVSGSGTTAATAAAAATRTTLTEVANNSTDGSVKVDIAGPVLSFTIDVSLTQAKNGNGENGSFWLSDISACSVTNSFPTAYRRIAQPLTNQPGYVLVARNHIVYMTDPATGRSVEVFQDPSNQNINSMGYDPHNRILYYTNSLTGSGGGANASNKTIKKYDFNTETLSVLVSDVTAALAIPTFGSGVESGGASFYDGALYLGIEGTDKDRSIIWRIDFDANSNAVSARQAFGIALTGHDWGDFVIANGILYDFDGAANGNENVYHVDLQTGAFLASYPAPFGIRQVAVDWTEKMYNIGGAPSAAGEVVPYNYNGTVDATQFKAITVGATTPTGSWGDAAEAFRPKVDFGDAPASYDPDPLRPAFHDRDKNLRLGDTLKGEWSRLSNSNTDDDDDGMSFVPILNQGGGVYQADVRVFNNTGANATVGGWIDFNGNGSFETNEGVTVEVGSSASMQVVSLYWTGISYNLPNNSSTYFRIRVTSSANNMTKANPTGYFANGEVEDWYMLVNATTLPVTLTDFTAQRWNGNNAKITWAATENKSNALYELQRSEDGVEWLTIHKKQSGQQNQNAFYSFIDKAPATPNCYYRLKYAEPGTPVHYSSVQKVTFDLAGKWNLYPNPASQFVTIQLGAIVDEAVQLRIVDINGKTVLTQKVQLEKGNNAFAINIGQLQRGSYQVYMITTTGLYSQKLIVQKQ